MSEIATAIAQIRAVAEEHGIAELAREAGVPYTTVHSFEQRGWTHKSVEVVDQLSAAAKRLTKRQKAAKRKAGRA